MAGSAPLVSVVIPSYNCACYLPEAIESVLAQTYRPIEIVVVDDGSTDDTPEILARYRDRVRVVRQENQGRAAARNTGILAAKGDYLAFLDADDLWRPQKLALQMALLEADPALGWVYCDLRRFDELGEEETSTFGKAGVKTPPEGRIVEAVLSFWLISTITVVARASCFSCAGLFDSRFPVAEDYDMWLRLACTFDAGCVNEVLSLYRQHDAQVSPHLTRSDLRAAQRRFGQIGYHTWKVLEKFARGPYLALPVAMRVRVRPLLRRRLAEYACAIAEGATAGHERGTAVRWLTRAFLLCPVVPIHRPGLVLDAALPAILTAALRRLLTSRRRALVATSDFFERWG